MPFFGYKAYRKGFFGCMETEDRYVGFLFSRGIFRPITTYAKEDFQSHDHFLPTLHKFVPRHFFLLRPVPFKSVGAGDLTRVGQAMAGMARHGARLRPTPIALGPDESGAA